MKLINKNVLDKLAEESKNSGRLRKNLNYHEKLSDPLQRLLNAMEPNTYVQPHKHENPDKREFFIILQGKAVVVTFKDNGLIDTFFLLDPTIKNFGVEIPPRIWHTIIVLQKSTILFEVKDGPYQQTSDKDFAHWAPKEDSPKRFDYNKQILQEIGVNEH